MVKKYFFILLCVLLILCGCQPCISLYFSPSNDCEDHVIETIDKAEHTVDVAIYSLTNRKIADALIRAHNRGVKVRILADRLQASQKHSLVLELYQKGLNVRIHSVHKIEHNKMALIDDRILITGSYNWTTAATKYNSENCLFLSKDSTTLTKAKNHINELWQKNDESKSSAWFYKKSLIFD